MSGVATAVGVVGGASYLGGRSAARQQRNAANQAAAERKAGQEKALAEYQPWRGYEDKARTAMGDILGYNGEDASTSAYTALMNSPAFQMRLKTGTAGIDRSAAAGGGLFSGNTGKALVQYGQDLGSQEFQNEYARRAGMFDWAYGNTGNRAKIYTGLGDIGAERALQVGAANANESMAFPNALTSGINAGIGVSSIYKNLGMKYGSNRTNRYGNDY